MRTLVAAVTGSLLVTGLALAAQAPAKSPASPPAGDHAAMAGMPHAAKAPASDAEKIRTATSAAPADIGRHAAVMEPGPDGQMKELRAGTNGWMCMPAPEAMCLDKTWQGWAEAWMSKKDPEVKGIGIAYMLRGDQGASNTDPFAKEQTPDNQWIVSPAHVMVLTSDTAQLDAVGTDPHSGGPWVMWKGTKYAHIMVPTVAMPPGAGKPAAKGAAKAPAKGDADTKK